MIKPASFGISTLHHDWRDRWSLCVGEDEFLIMTPIFAFLASYRGYDFMRDGLVTRLSLWLLPAGRGYLGDPKWLINFDHIFELFPHPLRKEIF